MHKVVLPEFGDVYLNPQQRFLTISENLQDTYSFDSEGRFLMGFLGGVNYRRGLENGVLMKHASAHGQPVRQFLSDAENRRLIDDIQARVQKIRHYLSGDDEQAAIQHWLDTILSWDFERLQADRATFQSIYQPIGILPPDQYLSVVLQAAEGCSWNRCTFCTFYQDRTFRIKSPAEFQRHMQHIKAFLGRSINLRKSIFLGDANALIIPQKRLIELLRLVHTEFPIGSPRDSYDYVLRGIYAFLDIFGAERKSLDEYRELRAYDVRRIYIGLETGDEEVFQLLNKPGSPQACVDAVRTIKAAGIDVGIIVLAGAGGNQLAAQHVEHSLHTIAQMQPGPRDIVYISPLVVSDTSLYAQRLHARGIQPLDQTAIMAQVQSIKASLAAMGQTRPKVTLYNIEEFIY